MTAHVIFPQPRWKRLASAWLCSRAAMRWAQVDFEAEVITVGKAKTARGTGRQIPMNPQLKAVLEMHAAWYANPKRLGEILPEWCVFPGRKAVKVGEPRPLNPNVHMKNVKSSWKPWSYVMMPHDAIDAAATLDGLQSQFLRFPAY